MSMLLVHPDPAKLSASWDAKRTLPLNIHLTVCSKSKIWRPGIGACEPEKWECGHGHVHTPVKMGPGTTNGGPPNVPSCVQLQFLIASPQPLI